MKIKPCPFCGKVPHETITPSNNELHAICTCGVLMHHAAWNHRPREEELLEVLRKIRKMHGTHEENFWLNEAGILIQKYEAENE